MKKASEYRYLEASVVRNGRCERIRTFDPLHPMQVRYQAAPHTEVRNYSLANWVKLVLAAEQFPDFKELAAHQLQPLLGQAGIGQVIRLTGHGVIDVSV